MQESQLRFLEQSQRHLDTLDQHERVLDQLLHYALANESAHLDIEERWIQLERRIKRIKEQN